MANIALDAGKVVLKDGKASCTCCEENPCNYQNVCINGVPVTIGGTGRCSCGGQTTDFQLCANDTFSCYFIFFECDLNAWFVFFYADAGGGAAASCGAMLISESPFGTYTDIAFGPCTAKVITVSQCA
jgi:hypothetical protein